MAVPALRRTRSAVALVALIALVGLSAPGAEAWLTPGHRRVTISAVRLLPESVPAFFRDGAATIAEGAVDPDAWRNQGTPSLADRETPEHYLDTELLGGEALPPLRSDYLALLARLGRAPKQVGFLPYAIVEGAERLALCFAEHRRWPDNEAIRAKCLFVAGLLSHYAGDLQQPLHTTIHHDGRARPDGSSPLIGLHRPTDALFQLDPNADSALAAKEAIAAPAELWAAVRSELARSFALVDRVYELAPRIVEQPEGAPGAPVPPTPAVDAAALQAFTAERYRSAARFIAELMLWSWERSASIELPNWLTR